MYFMIANLTTVENSFEMHYGQNTQSYKIVTQTECCQFHLNCISNKFFLNLV